MFSPLPNGINENNYIAVVINREIIERDTKIVFKDVVNMASWTHNINVMMRGYTPMQLITRKDLVFSGISQGNVAT